MAVALERLSPLAIAAIASLIVGTFLTLLVVPVLYYLLESGRLTAAYETEFRGMLNAHT
jgi:Cu/Ag efflux pump CusA